jgi:4-amino-4-deoxy-L-arabinose transferase-like glycosyltransferase
LIAGSGEMPWLTDRRLVLAALAAWAAVALIGLVFGPTLGHDEAAFALAARGAAPPGAWLYRSDGTVALARIGLALGGAEWQLRLVSTILSFGVLVAVYAVGRAAFTARTGAWAAAVLAGAHPMALRSAELLSDLPSMACLLGGIAMLISELDREDGPRWRIVAAAPLFAAGFYVRYGSAPVATLSVAVALALWWRAALRRPLPVLVMLATLAALAIPHLVRSLDATGTMFGILGVSAGMPRRAYIGEGLVTYLTSNPFLFYGFIVAPVMVAGLGGAFQARTKAAWYLAIVALGQLVSLGLQSHGQPRYVFVATGLLVVLGVEVVARSRHARTAIGLGVVATSWVGLTIAAPIYHREVDRARAPLIEAARAISARNPGRPCAVIALIVPQLTWYSRCEVFAVGLLDHPLPADHDRYAASFQRWPVDLAAIVARQHLRATPIPTGDPRAQVWQLE